MLVFVVPLKSRRVSRSWSRTCQLFERALRSMCRQTSPDFQVMVVCHDAPEIAFQHPNVRYLTVAFPPPADERRARLMDRRRKELEGFVAAARLGRCHVLKADADDCVSRRLAELVGRHPDVDGWYIDRGYVYLEGADRIRPKRSGFYRWCGTSGIVRSDRLRIASAGLMELPREEAAYLEIERRYYVPHMDLVDVMRRHRTSLLPLPFAGAVYVVGHGENSGEVGAEQIFLSRHSVVRAARRLLSLRKITGQIRDEFGLYDLDRAPVPAGNQ